VRGARDVSRALARACNFLRTIVTSDEITVTNSIDAIQSASCSSLGQSVTADELVLFSISLVDVWRFRMFCSISNS